MDSLLLRCATGAAIKDVYRDRGRVRVVGAAGARSVGKSSRSACWPPASVVGRTKVRADGSFSASVALPGAAGAAATRRATARRSRARSRRRR